MPQVLNRHHVNVLTPNDNRVFIGRPSMWGNPFVIGKDGTREEVVAKYEEYLRRTPTLMMYLDDLRGKDLVCYCAPLLCHGDVLLRYANLTGGSS